MSRRAFWAALLVLAPAMLVAGCGSGDGKVRRNPQGVLVAPFTGAKTKLPRRPMAVATGGGSVWVTSFAGGVLTRVDPRTGKKVGKPVAIDDAPYNVLHAFGRVWVVAFQNDKLFEVNPSTGKVIRFTKVDNRPFGIAAGFGSLWLTSIRGETLSRIDPATGRRVGARIALSGPPLQVTTGFGSVWVTNVRDGVVERIDPTRNKVVQKIRIGGPTCNSVATRKALGDGADEVNDVVVNCGAPADIIAAGRWIWVSNLRGPAVREGQAKPAQVKQGIPSGQVWRIDPRSGRVVRRPIPVPVRPLAMAGDSRSIWVVGVDVGTLTRIDTRTGAPDRLPIDVGRTPTDVALGYGKVWVPLSKDDRLAALPGTNR